ncbi:HNH endonuclease [Nocardia beijingensis]
MAIPVDASLHTKYCGKDCRPMRRPAGRITTAPKSVRLREAQCEYCGKPYTTTKTRQRYCSEWCSDTAYNGPAESNYHLRLGRTCVRCGIRIPDAARVNKRFCTVTCQVCFNQEMRRARKRGLPVEKISRAEIFERDNYTCHICHGVIEDKPVLDHLIPLALPDSPGHVWENVAAAHGFCNSSKCARVRPEDYELYLRLRLERQ